MAKDKKSKAPKAEGAPESGLLDKLTTLTMVLFFCILGVAHLR